MHNENKCNEYDGPVMKLAPISRSQYRGIYHVCLNVRQKLIVSLLYEGGLRVEELADIRIGDLQKLDDGEIRIVSKNDIRPPKLNTNGIIFVPEYVIRLTQDYLQLETRNNRNESLITIYHNRNFERDYYSETAADKLFQRLSHRCGIDVRPYMLRHGFAQEKLHEGWREDEVLRYLAHNNMADPDGKQYFNEKDMMQSFFRKYSSSIDPEIDERRLA